MKIKFYYIILFVGHFSIFSLSADACANVDPTKCSDIKLCIEETEASLDSISEINPNAYLQLVQDLTKLRKWHNDKLKCTPKI